jgi:hypothetical protein
MAVGRVLQEPVLIDIARRHQRSVAQIVLRWVIQQPGLIALSRTTNPARLSENLSVFDFELETQEMMRICALARPGSRIVDPAGLAPDWDSTEIVRHPIYTGLILAVARTGLAQDKGIWFFMLVVIFASYWLKIRVEERLMMETFPEEYPAYRRRVKALIPGIL